jgi:hypothetical protein
MESQLAELLDPVKGVKSFRAHWMENHDRSISAVYAALAELEGLWGLTRRFPSVEALTHQNTKGGTPDALVRHDRGPCLFEIKSLWAYPRLKELKQWPTGTFPFGKTGRLRKDEIGRLDITYGQWNSRLVRSAVTEHLATATRQMTAYAERIKCMDCPKTVLLVATQRQPIFGVLDSPRRFAATWLERHRTRVSDVVWVVGDSWESLATYTSL